MNVQNLTLKKAMLAALEATHGIVTQACDLANVSRTTHYEWLKIDPEYKQAVDDLQNVAIDFVENALFQQISNGNHVSTIFYLKCKGKSRGYVESETNTSSEATQPTVINVFTAPPPTDEPSV
jgi:hypothetical protein